MPLSISGDSPNFTNATLTTPTLTSPTFAGTPTGSIITSGTAVASTSGTSIDFTSIPSWVKRITVMFNGVSTSGTSQPLVQLGDAGGIEATGYVSTSIGLDNSSGSTGANSTAGFIIARIQASDTISGHMVITLFDASTFSWVSSENTKNNTGIVTNGGGNKSLSSTLDRIRITTVNGTDTFDAGSINILYE